MYICIHYHQAVSVVQGLYEQRQLLPSVLLPVVISSRLVRVAHLFSLSGPHEHPSLPRLFGEAVVDVGDYDECCAFWIADAHIYPVISVEEATTLL